MSLFCSWAVINWPALPAPWLRLSPWSHQIKDICPPSELCQNHRRHISAVKARLAYTHRPHSWCFPGVLTWRRRRDSRHPGSSLPGWRVRNCGCAFGTRRVDPAPPQPETPPPQTWFRKQTQTDGLVYLPAEGRAKEWAVSFFGAQISFYLCAGQRAGVTSWAGVGFGCSSAVRVCVGTLLAGIPESHARHIHIHIS